jgi:hypothetical protein
MAGVMTHMVIAREIMQLLPEGVITDPGLFYLGNLAPDAVHAREDYTRAYKKQTHLREDIADKDFEKPENLTLFHERLAKLIIEFKSKEDELLDYYRGYIVHLLTDELFILTLRKEFCEIMERQGINQMNHTFFELVVSDMTCNDMLLVNRYCGCDEIRKYLEHTLIYPVEGYISEQEMQASRDWLIDHHFVEINEIKEPIYISYERTVAFIQYAAETIINRLKNGTNLPVML